MNYGAMSTIAGLTNIWSYLFILSMGLGEGAGCPLVIS